MIVRQTRQHEKHRILKRSSDEIAVEGKRHFNSLKVEEVNKLLKLEPTAKTNPVPVAVVRPARIEINDHVLSGSFKYVLIEGIRDNKAPQYFIQGCPVDSPKRNLRARANTKKTCKHPDAFRRFLQPILNTRVDVNDFRVIGGGRISKKIRSSSVDEGTIKIFGYSKTYSKRLGASYNADTNEISCRIIKQHVFQISRGHNTRVQVLWSNEGYEAADVDKIHSFSSC